MRGDSERSRSRSRFVMTLTATQHGGVWMLTLYWFLIYTRPIGIDGALKPLSFSFLFIYISRFRVLLFAEEEALFI